MSHPAILGPAALILIVLFILLVLLFLVPIDLEVRVARGWDRSETRIRAVWLFGHLHKDVFIGGEREPWEKRDEQSSERVEEEGEEEGEGGEEGEYEGGGGSIRLALEVLRTEGFLGNLARLLRGLLETLQVRNLSIDMKVGLSDPAETGEAVGLLAAALAPLEALAPVRARIVPSFAEEEIAGSVEGWLRIWPIKAILPIARFLLYPPAWRAGWRAASVCWREGVLWKR